MVQGGNRALWGIYSWCGTQDRWLSPPTRDRQPRSLCLIHTGALPVWPKLLGHEVSAERAPAHTTEGAQGVGAEDTKPCPLSGTSSEGGRGERQREAGQQQPQQPQCCGDKVAAGERQIQPCSASVQPMNTLAQDTMGLLRALGINPSWN